VQQFYTQNIFCVDIDKYNVVGLYIVGSNRLQLSIIRSGGRMVAYKMEFIIFRRHAVEWGLSTPSSLKVMGHDIHEHKIKTREIKTKMCRLKILDCLLQWEV
jgi:hypothetical protein